MYIVQSQFNSLTSFVTVLSLWLIVLVRCTREDGCDAKQSLSEMLTWGYLDTFSTLLLTFAAACNTVVVFMAFTAAEVRSGLPRLIMATHMLGWFGALLVTIFTIDYNSQVHYAVAVVAFLSLNAQVWLLVAHRRGRKWHAAQTAYALLTTASILAFVASHVGWFEIANITLLILGTNWMSVDYDEVVVYRTLGVAEARAGV